MKVHHADPPFKVGPGNPRADTSPDGFVQATAFWWDAVNARDYRRATRLCREIRRRYRVSICLAPEKRGPT